MIRNFSDSQRSYFAVFPFCFPSPFPFYPPSFFFALNLTFCDRWLARCDLKIKPLSDPLFRRRQCRIHYCNPFEILQFIMPPSTLNPTGTTSYNSLYPYIRGILKHAHLLIIGFGVSWLTRQGRRVPGDH
jgi:hypothetical protein